MTLKSQSTYACPQCATAWLPFRPGLSCPACKRAVPDTEVTLILAEALESARYNVRLYGRYQLEFWLTRTLGDRYLEWAFKALQAAVENPDLTAQKAAVAALLDVNLEDMTPYREHVVEFLTVLIEQWREAKSQDAKAWEKMPEPEKPFFGRKIIES